MTLAQDDDDTPADCADALVVATSDEHLDDRMHRDDHCCHYCDPSARDDQRAQDRPLDDAVCEAGSRDDRRFLTQTRCRCKPENKHNTKYRYNKSYNILYF